MEKNNRWFGVLLSLILLSLINGCASSYQNRNIVGKTFPTVTGTSLDGQSMNIPSEFHGRKVLLILGYVQNSQFDIDRWLIGLDMTKTDIEVYELPTIQGLFPQFFETQINQGMQKGIPKSLWKGVVTIFDGGQDVQQFTGNINPNNARVILLNENNEIMFFDDSGFSVASLNQLRAQIVKKL